MYESFDGRDPLPLETKVVVSEGETDSTKTIEGAVEMFEMAESDVVDFKLMGLPQVEKIAAEMGVEVDEKTKTDLLALNDQAEMARQYLEDTFVGKLRSKFGALFKKYLPDSALTALIEKKNAEFVSRKIVKNLQIFYDDSGLDEETRDQFLNYFTKYKDLLSEKERNDLEDMVKKALSSKISQEINKLLYYESGDCPQAFEALDYFLKNKDSLNDSDKRLQDHAVFIAITSHLTSLVVNHPSQEGVLAQALDAYKKIPSEFLKDKDLMLIGDVFLSKARDNGISEKDIILAFGGNLELLAAGIAYSQSGKTFSTENNIKIVDEVYEKYGASASLATYVISDFEKKDQEKVLVPLFESYKKYRPDLFLTHIEVFNDLYNKMPEQEREEFIITLIPKHLDLIFQKIDYLNLNTEQKGLVLQEMITYKKFDIIKDDSDLKKLDPEKNKIFEILQQTDPVSLFVYRKTFALSPEQYSQNFERITSNLSLLEKALSEIYQGYSSNDKFLTKDEFPIFESLLVEKAPYLIFKFRDVFEKTYTQERNIFLKDLPENLDESEHQEFIRYVVLDLGGWEKNKERIQALLRESQEQKVTTEYLEQLEMLQLTLPKRVFQKVKENIKRAEQKNMLEYFREALSTNSTLEHVQREMQEQLEQVVKNAHYFKTIHFDGLKAVLTKDYRFKTQFEIDSTGGVLNRQYRSQQESSMFDYSYDIKMDRHVRPNYGYMSDDENGRVEGNGLSNYGCIQIKFKESEVKQRTTVTFQDSLGLGEKSPPTPALKPHFTSIKTSSFGRKVQRASNPLEWDAKYLEVQYHWPLKISAVESVHISRDSDLSKEQMRQIEEMISQYNRENPENTIKLVMYGK